MVGRITEVWQYKVMLRSLVLSELRTRYKGSFLGFLWTFINPLLMLVVYTMIFKFVMRVTVPHYAVFMFIGLLSWNMFATTVAASSSVVVRQSSLVKKIYFPREVLPLSVVGGSLINYLLSLLILLPVLIMNGYTPTSLWLFFPLILLVEVLFSCGLALAFSALTVFLRDLEHMLGIFLMAWFYVTPVVYSLAMIPPKMMEVFKLNPMTDVVLALQQIFYYGSPPNWKMLVYGAGVSVVMLLFGWGIFVKLNRRFAEEV